MNKIISSGLVITAIISLNGCGGSDDSVSKVTGQFVDTYVAGLNYECTPSGVTGVTDTEGYYTCNSGDTVEFSLGGYVLGSTTASEGIVTPESLYPEDEEAALNVAQLLQTLDDGSNEGIITIPENFTDLDDVNTTPEEDGFEDDMVEALPEVDSLVSEEDAQEHLDEAELTVLFSGNTVYSHKGGKEDYLVSLSFNLDVDSATITPLAGPDTGESRIQVISIDDGKLSFGSEGDYYIIEEVTEDYVLLKHYESDETDSNGEIRFYFDEEKAETYFDSLYGPIEITEEKLSGKTFYSRESGDNDYGFAVMTFDDGTLTRSEIWYDDNDEPNPKDTFSLPYDLIDGKIRVDVTTFGEGWFWFALLSENVETWDMKEAHDIDKDGETEDSSEGTFSWYLSKPGDFPNSL